MGRTELCVGMTELCVGMTELCVGRTELDVEIATNRSFLRRLFIASLRYFVDLHGVCVAADADDVSFRDDHEIIVLQNALVLQQLNRVLINLF